jgi:uncharacterized protein YxjI
MGPGRWHSRVPQWERVRYFLWVRYLMSQKFSLFERFDITDESGSMAFQAKGHLGSAITLHDPHGGEVAGITKHVFTDTHEISVNGERVAQVRHTGFFGDRYEIESSFGVLTASGRWLSNNFTMQRGGMVIAEMVQQWGWGEKFALDISDSENAPFILAVMLALEAIHQERENQNR